MNSMKFINTGSAIMIAPNLDGVSTDTIPPAIYRPMFKQSSPTSPPEMVGFEKVMNEYELPTIYGDEVTSNATFMIERYMDRGNLSALFYGPPGASKTLTCMYISNKLIEQGYPVILINQNLNPNDLSAIYQLVGKGVIFIDEFDRVYSDEDSKDSRNYTQEDILTVMGGGRNNNQALTLLTSNDIDKIRPEYRHRPGRVTYWVEANALSSTTINEILEDITGYTGLMPIANSLANVECTMDMITSIAKDIKAGVNPYLTCQRHKLSLTAEKKINKVTIGDRTLDLDEITCKLPFSINMDLNFDQIISDAIMAKDDNIKSAIKYIPALNRIVSDTKQHAPVNILYSPLALGTIKDITQYLKTKTLPKDTDESLRCYIRALAKVTTASIEELEYIVEIISNFDAIVQLSNTRHNDSDSEDESSKDDSSENNKLKRDSSKHYFVDTDSFLPQNNRLCRIVIKGSDENEIWFDIIDKSGPITITFECTARYVKPMPKEVKSNDDEIEDKKIVKMH